MYTKSGQQQNEGLPDNEILLQDEAEKEGRLFSSEHLVKLIKGELYNDRPAVRA